MRGNKESKNYMTKQTATPSKNTTPPFVSDNPFAGAPELYASKDEHIDKGLLFDIHGVEFQREQGFEGADRWLLTIETHYPNGKIVNEIMSFGPNQKRDEQMSAAIVYIKKNGPVEHCRLAKSGNAQYINVATKEEVANYFAHDSSKNGDPR